MFEKRSKDRFDDGLELNGICLLVLLYFCLVLFYFSFKGLSLSWWSEDEAFFIFRVKIRWEKGTIRG